MCSVTLRLLKHDEEYVFGLPSAYARSILTVPWVELGDKITLTCEKTNLAANIIFHTKVRRPVLRLFVSGDGQVIVSLLRSSFRLRHVIRSAAAGNQWSRPKK